MKTNDLLRLDLIEDRAVPLHFAAIVQFLTGSACLTLFIGGALGWSVLLDALVR
jgi:hypothetical protein